MPPTKMSDLVGEQDIESTTTTTCQKIPVAKPFYANFGFMEVGRDRDGKVIAVLKLACSDDLIDPLLQRAIDAFAVPGLLIGHRVILARR